MEWHAQVRSTNELAAAAAERGVPEIHAVLADVQTAGRGRRGRCWTAPPGSSLLMSLVVRPRADLAARGLLPLVTGLALVDALTALCPTLDVGLKWPNDLLVRERKAAGVLVEALPGGAVVVGCGVNVDWRGVDRGEALAAATSLAEAGCAVQRWDLLAALVPAFAGRYREWGRDPRGFLPEYRRRCRTLGLRVRVTDAGSGPLEGTALDVDQDGALLLADDAGNATRLVAGDVEGVRPV